MTEFCLQLSLVLVSLSFILATLTQTGRWLLTGCTYVSFQDCAFSHRWNCGPPEPFGRTDCPDFIRHRLPCLMRHCSSCLRVRENYDFQLTHELLFAQGSGQQSLRLCSAIFRAEAVEYLQDLASNTSLSQQEWKSLYQEMPVFAEDVGT